MKDSIQGLKSLSCTKYRAHFYLNALFTDKTSSLLYVALPCLDNRPDSATCNKYKTVQHYGKCNRNEQKVIKECKWKIWSVKQSLACIVLCINNVAFKSENTLL